jgi:F-type H+-transporting ATPase subunit b
VSAIRGLRRVGMVVAGFAQTMLLPLWALAQDLPPEVADPHHHEAFHFEVTDVLLGAFVNFGLLVFLFVWFGRKKLIPYLVQRRKLVEDELAEAARLTEQAQEAHRQYSEKLATLSQELEKIRAELRAAGEEEKQRMVEEAEARAASMKRDAELLIEQQMTELRDSVTREVVDAAVQTAREVLTGAVKAEDQERLAQTYLAELRTVLGNGSRTTANANRPLRQHEEHA